MSFLDEILAAKRDEVDALRSRAAPLSAEAAAAPPVRDLPGALRSASGLAVIAEIKRRSPSKGELAPGLDPGTIVRSYERGGASALSVLTDGPHFGGSIDDLVSARAACGLPVLRKDFVIDPIQVTETRAAGADAVLLIVAALDDASLADTVAAAEEHGMAALVEVHSTAELERALRARTSLIGVNSRDLHTFDEDLGVAEEVAARIPSEVLAVAESGVRRPEDATRVARAGYRAALVGEALVRADDPVELLGSLRVVVPSASRAGG